MVAKHGSRGGHIDADVDLPCLFCGCSGLHVCNCSPHPMVTAVAEDIFASKAGTDISAAEPIPEKPTRIVAMCEFKNDLYVASETGVFILDPEDGRLYPVEIVYAGVGPIEFYQPCEAMRDILEPAYAHRLGQRADELAGLTPLDPAKPEAAPEKPYEPRKFGEHGD